MNSTIAVKPPAWFWAVALVALLWNLLGVMAFAMHMMMTPESLAALPEAERNLYETTPIWVTIAFAVAVFGGALGALGLLMRKAWARLLFIISFVGLIIQASYNFLLSDTFEILGSGAMLMPIVVIVIAVFLIWFANMATRRHWLT